MLSLKRSTAVDFEVPLGIEPNNMTGYDVLFWNRYLLGVKKVQATPISQQSMSVPFRGSCQTFRRALYGGPSQAANTWDITQKTISNGNRTEWSPIRSVIIRVITKSDDRAAGVRFVYHEYDYRPELDDTKSYYQLIIKITISEKRRIAKL